MESRIHRLARSGVVIVVVVVMAMVVLVVVMVVVVVVVMVVMVMINRFLTSRSFLPHTAVPLGIEYNPLLILFKSNKPCPLL